MMRGKALEAVGALGRKARDEEREQKSCPLHGWFNRILHWHKGLLLSGVKTLEGIPEVLRKGGDGHWLCKQLKSLCGKHRKAQGLNQPNTHFMKPNQSVPTVSLCFPG